MTNPISLLSPSERLVQYQALNKPYSYDDNVKVLIDEARQTANDAADQPADSCPDDMAQISVTMHPAFSSKAYFPEEFLVVMKLKCIGARQVQVFPRQSFEETDIEDGEFAVSLICVGKRSDLQEIPKKLGLIIGDTLVGNQIQMIESIEAVSIYDRMDVPNDYFSEFFLVGIYQTPDKTVQESREAFTAYAKKEGFEVHPTFTVEKDGIFYVLVKGERYKLDAIGDYCYTFTVRVPPKRVS